MVRTVDGVPSAIDVNGAFYAIPRAAWDDYAATSTRATAVVNARGDVALRREGAPDVKLEGPIRCE